MELFKDMTAKNVRNYSLFIFIIPKLFQIFFCLSSSSFSSPTSPPFDKNLEVLCLSSEINIQEFLSKWD